MFSEKTSSKFLDSFNSKKPFVLYSKPNCDVLNSIFQISDDLFLANSRLDSGFLIAPFDSNEKAYLIPLSESDFIQEKINFKVSNDISSAEKKYNEDQKRDFEVLVSKIISEINTTQISKIVASRTEEFDLENIDILKIFEVLLSKYQSAFKYCFYLPNIGFWLGATPEKLLSIDDNVLETMSYAGTQVFNGELNPQWGEKEKVEQQLVTDFIISNLENESSWIEVSNPYTSKAATLLHIRTDIKANLNKDYSLERIIEKLHPTPAVCGMPKDLAKNFILKNEGYNRSFYSGYLGEINFGEKNTTELYVNLRCMEIKNNKVSIYVGCGITKDSDPELEFFETVNKSITMKSLFV